MSSQDDGSSEEIISESEEYMGFPEETEADIISDDSDEMQDLPDIDDEEDEKPVKKAKGRKKKDESEESEEVVSEEEEQDTESDPEVESEPDEEDVFENDSEAGSGSEYEDNEEDEPVGSGPKTPVEIKKHSSVESDEDSVSLSPEKPVQIIRKKTDSTKEANLRFAKKDSKTQPLLVVLSYPGETTVERDYLDTATEIVEKDYFTNPFRENLVRSAVNYKLKGSRYYKDLNTDAGNISKQLNL